MRQLLATALDVRRGSDGINQSIGYLITRCLPRRIRDQLRSTVGGLRCTSSLSSYSALILATSIYATSAPPPLSLHCQSVLLILYLHLSLFYLSSIFLSSLVLSYLAVAAQDGSYSTISGDVSEMGGLHNSKENPDTASPGVPPGCELVQLGF